MGNSGSEDDKVSREVWKKIETSTEKIGLGEAKGRSWKEEREKDKKRKQKKEKTMEVKKVAEEWEIWDDDEEAARSEEEAKKIVSRKFHL